MTPSCAGWRLAVRFECNSQLLGHCPWETNFTGKLRSEVVFGRDGDDPPLAPTFLQDVLTAIAIHYPATAIEQIIGCDRPTVGDLDGCESDPVKRIWLFLQPSRIPNQHRFLNQKLIRHWLLNHFPFRRRFARSGRHRRR